MPLARRERRGRECDDLSLTDVRQGKQFVP
jgi:hypothetical protein